MLAAVQLAAAVALVILLPGFALTYTIFGRDRKHDLLERTSLAFALGAASMTLLTYVLNAVLGILLPYATIISLAVICGGSLAYLMQRE